MIQLTGSLQMNKIVKINFYIVNTIIMKNKIIFLALLLLSFNLMFAQNSLLSDFPKGYTPKEV